MWDMKQKIKRHKPYVTNGPLVSLLKVLIAVCRSVSLNWYLYHMCMVLAVFICFRTRNRCWEATCWGQDKSNQHNQRSAWTCSYTIKGSHYSRWWCSCAWSRRQSCHFNYNQWWNLWLTESCRWTYFCLVDFVFLSVQRDTENCNLELWCSCLKLHVCVRVSGFLKSYKAYYLANVLCSSAWAEHKLSAVIHLTMFEVWGII